MKIAIMQPYFFPYLGYYKLINEADVFVFLDDVQYIRRGWVNRNRVDIENPKFFTVPVSKCKRETKIKDIKISDHEDWVKRHVEKFKNVFGKNIESNEVIDYYKTLSDYKNLSDMVCDSVIWMANHIGLSCKFDFSHRYPSIKNGKFRIIELCKIFGASRYVNLPGGRNLYDFDEFKTHGIDLDFLNTDGLCTMSILERVFKYESSILVRHSARPF